MCFLVITMTKSQIESRYRDCFEKHTINIHELNGRNAMVSQLQLEQSQKLEALGQLAGGVAHDFNNLLTAILGYTELSLRRDDLDHPLRHNLEETKRAAERAASLIRQLLALRKWVNELASDCLQSTE